VTAGVEAPVDQGFVTPAYADCSLADVLPAVGRALGVRMEAEEPPDLGLPEARHYVVLLVDGLGSELLASHADDAPFLSGLLEGSLPATAGVPSTTATSLTSLGTGTPPGSHGVLGYTTRIPGTTSVLNALRWSKDVDPTVWQAQPTAFSRLAAAGVHTTVVNKREFEGSGLTVASCRGAVFVGVDRPGERLVDLHLWRLGPGHHAAIAVIAAEAPQPPQAYRARLAGLAGLSHVTLEVRPAS